MSMKAVKVIDIICIVIFVLMGVYIFALPEATQNLLLPVFTIINPYKTGAWIMGIGFLVTCLWGKGKAGFVLGVVLLACYLITAFVSLVGLMVVTTGFDLLWYLHPIPVVIGCIVAIRWHRSLRSGLLSSEALSADRAAGYQ